MMKTKIILSIMFLIGVAVTSADAQIVRANANSRVRVAAGVKSGDITRSEAHRLRKEQRHIRHDIHRARKNDGHIGPRERKHIRHEQRKHSRHIYIAKHNKRTRS